MKLELGKTYTRISDNMIVRLIERVTRIEGDDVLEAFHDELGESYYHDLPRSHFKFLVEYIEPEIIHAEVVGPTETQPDKYIFPERFQGKKIKITIEEDVGGE